MLITKQDGTPSVKSIEMSETYDLNFYSTDDNEDASLISLYELIFNVF